MIFASTGIILLALLHSSAAAVGREELKCLVCQSVVDEIEAEIASIDPKKTIQVRSYRLDGEGNTKPNSVPYARSEAFLNEAMDGVCESFEDYAQGTHKRNGRVALVRITTKDGKMNPEMGNYDLLPNPDENAKSKFHCERLVEEHEDDIIALFAKNKSEPAVELCEIIANYCEEGKVPRSSSASEEEYTFEDHDEL